MYLLLLLLSKVVHDSPPEVIFMVGLPASGKTTFAQNYVKNKKKQDLHMNLKYNNVK